MKTVSTLVVVLLMTAFTENYVGLDVMAENVQKNLLLEWTSFKFDGLLLTLLPMKVDPNISEKSNAERGFVKFLLYNSGRNGIPSTERFLLLDPTKVTGSIPGFNASLLTMIFIHGFMETENGIAVRGLLSAISQSGRWNLVFVDWKLLSAGPWYSTSVYNAQATGQLLAKFIDWLAHAVQRNFSQTPNGKPWIKRPPIYWFLENLHIVGFSLGAHVAGIAGQQVTVGKIGRITGLDPAFNQIDYFNAKELRLDETDAEFVDIIHTTGGYFGTPYASGHVDFFPNGGIPVQPGCNEVAFRKLCSHWRSCWFFAESVLNPDSFESLPCESWEKFAHGECDHRLKDANNGPVNMGVGAPKTARGRYYLRTSSAQPFSLSL